MRGGGTSGWPFYRGPKGQAYPTGRKQKCEKQLSLFFFSKVLFNSFWNFGFLKMQKIKIKYAVEKEKNKMVDFWSGRK
jgi:hypothetical protein